MDSVAEKKSLVTAHRLPPGSHVSGIRSAPTPRDLAAPSRESACLAQTIPIRRRACGASAS